MVERIEEEIEKLNETSKAREYFVGNSFTRERKMTSYDFVCYLLFQKGRTTNMELINYFKEKNQRYEQTITKQAFSKQRMNIKSELFMDITKSYVSDRYKEKEIKTFKRYKVLAIDGSVLELPNTKELREEYATPKYKNGSVARARISSLYDVENDYIVDSIIESYGKTERELAILNLNNAKEMMDIKQSIIIFDRGYYSESFLKEILELKCKFIFRLKSNALKKQSKLLKEKENKIKILDKEFRLTVVMLKTGEVEYLLTNIEEEIISYEEMKEFYFKRWKIEGLYDLLKNKTHIENFSGKSKLTIEQDFYAGIYLCNILEDIKKEANEEIKKEKQHNQLKYEYKTNMNILAGVLKTILIGVFVVEEASMKELYMDMIEIAKRNLVPVIPDRSNPRIKKSTRDKYKTNLRRNM